MTSKSSFRRAFQILCTEGPSTLAKKTALHAIRRSKIDTKFRHFKYQLKYASSSPDPYALIRVNPKDINHFLLNRPNHSTRGTYIIGGEWDRNFVDSKELYPLYSDPKNADKYKDQFDTSIICPFEDYEHWSSFVNHFQHGTPWDCTDFYQRLMNSPETNHPRYGHNEQEIRDALEYIDELHENISEEGYKTIHELLLEQKNIQVDGKEKKSINDYRQRQTEKDEVRIYIDRDGRLIHDCHKGTHRLTLAKIIGIGRIPVRVVARHKDWQEIRAQIVKKDDTTTLSSKLQKYVDHPDIRSILDNDDD